MARSVHLVLRPTLGGCGAFEILDGDKPRLFYIFKEIHCAIGGRGFAIRRAGREMYHVRIGKRHECECGTATAGTSSPCWHWRSTASSSRPNRSLQSRG
jgi:hypothetical protein